MNTTISAVGTFHAFLNMPRVRPESFTYLVAGTTSTAPPPKSKLPGAPLVAFFQVLTAALAPGLPTFPANLSLALAGLLLLWPIRPHSLLSCRAADCSLEANYLYLRPSAHKRLPSSHVFGVRLPDAWLPLFASLWDPSRGNPTFLFTESGDPPSGLGILTAVVASHFASLAPTFALYDYRRLCATCYYLAGAPMDRLLRLGGWTTSKTVM